MKKIFLFIIFLIITFINIKSLSFYSSKKITIVPKVPEVFAQGCCTVNCADWYAANDPCTGHSGCGSCNLSSTSCDSECVCRFTCQASCPDGWSESRDGGACYSDCTICDNDTYCNPPPPPSDSPPSDSPPEKSLVCTDLARSPGGDVKVGDSINFTCTGAAENVNINHYEFRASTNGGSSYTDITNPFTITSPKEHTIQCRVCSSERGAPEEHCTTWGAAGGWTP